MVKDTNEKQKLIIELDKDLTKTINEKIDKSNQLATMVEMERARLNDLITVTVQTEPLVSDASVQTDFIVPPVCLYLFFLFTITTDVLEASGFE